jgi:hypothetical protein
MCVFVSACNFVGRNEVCARVCAGGTPVTFTGSGFYASMWGQVCVCLCMRGLEKRREKTYIKFRLSSASL